MAANNSTKKRGQLMVQIGVLVIILVAMLLLFNSLDVFKDSTPSHRVVTYIVEGSAHTGMITYTKTDGISTEPENISIPWRLSVKFSKSYTVILTAANPTQIGSLKCIILLDGEEWKQEATDAPGDRVSCAGIVPK